MVEITRKGRYVVREYKGGPEISQHDVEREAIEAALNSGLETAWIDYPEGMEVALITYGGTLTGESRTTPASGQSVGFDSPSNPTWEGAGTLTFNVERTGAGQQALAIGFSLTPGTAVAGLDYTDISGTLNWNDGEVGVKSFTVTILPRYLTYQGQTAFTANLVVNSGPDDIVQSVSSATIEDWGVMEEVTHELGTRQDINGFNANNNLDDLGGINVVGNIPTIVTKATSMKDITPRNGTYMTEYYLNRGDPLPGEPPGTGCGAGQSPANAFRTQVKMLFPNHLTLNQGGHGMAYEESYALGFSIYLPADWAVSDLFEIDAQVIQAGKNPTIFNRNPNVVLEAREGIGGQWYLYGRYMTVLKGDVSDQINSFDIFPNGPTINEGWTDFVFNMLHNPLSDTSGEAAFLRVWIRDPVNTAWTEILDYDGPMGYNDGPDGAAGDWSDADAPWSLGTYKGWKGCANVEPTGIKERTQYTDDFRIVRNVGKISLNSLAFNAVAPPGVPFV